jgi:hypothetical protein
MKTHLTFLIGLMLAAPAAHAQTSTLGDGDSYPWSANTGWIEGTHNRPNAGDGFRFGEFACAGYLWSANTGWIHCGDGTPANGIQYANDGNTDYGVNHYGTGDLFGLAWSANTGWINFGWWTLEPTNPDRPRVDLQTGNFSGYAWGANTGWINLGSGLLKTDSMHITDSDNDGISDAWEIAYNNGDLNVMNATSNFDGDPATDLEEYLALTIPKNADSYLRLTNIAPASPFDGTATTLTWTSTPARLYTIEGATNLLLPTKPWSVSPLDPQTFTPDSGSTTTRTSQHTAAGLKYFRVEAVIPLQP